jgi:predicted DNA-binding transcriptional regulator AlpA
MSHPTATTELAHTATAGAAIGRPSPGLSAGATTPPVYLRASQAAERYGIARSTFWLYVKQAKFPQPYAFGTRIRLWKTDELDRAIEQFSPQSPSKETP